MAQTTGPGAVAPAARLAALLGDFDRSPAYAGLAAALREVIGDGRIAYGTRLPSERELTEALGVSRTTVTRAYAALRETSYAEARQGAGTFARLPGGPTRAHDQALFVGDVDGDAISLVCAASTAPPGIAGAYAEAVEELPSLLGGTGYFPAGLPSLQAEIARWYGEAGMPTAPDQIIVTSGALAALAVVGRALAGPRDRVLVESPTYPNGAQALRTGGGRLATVGLEAGGRDLDAYAQAVQRHRPRLAYLMPDFHNPTGLTMTTAERRATAALLRTQDTLAVVDEAHRPLHLDGAAQPPAFGALSRDALTIGSASKTVWSGLRMGWIRSPAPLVDRLTRARVTMDLGAPVLEQLVLARLFRDGLEPAMESHRARLREQRAVLVEALAQALPSWRYRMPAGGMVLWCELPVAGSTALAAESERLGLHLAPGPAFAPDGGLDRFVRLPYTQSPDVLREAVDRLASAWARVAGAAPAPARRAVATPAGGRRTDPMLVA